MEEWHAQIFRSYTPQWQTIFRGNVEDDVHCGCGGGNAGVCVGWCDFDWSKKVIPL